MSLLKSPTRARGSKLSTFVMKDLFFINDLIAFHSSVNSPKKRTTTLNTFLTAYGGLGSEASSLRLLELMPDTDFFAYSIRG